MALRRSSARDEPLECGAAELVDFEFGDYGDRSRFAVGYRLLRASAGRLLIH
jgi:hypothetical protein